MEEKEKGAAPVWKLGTKRLRLRELTEEDWPDVCRMLQDEEVMRAWEHPFTEEEVRLWMARQIARYREYRHKYGLWAVVRKSDGRLIGQMGLTLQDRGDRYVLEIGYVFEKAAWHHGYAIEAARALRDYAFRHICVDEVYSIIRENNGPSLAVARRNGMTPSGEVVRHYYGIDMVHKLCRITREEWNRLEKAGSGTETQKK